MDRQRAGQLLFPAVGYIILYSILPHKELRFIIYTIPIFNTVAAMACNRLWQKRKRSRWHNILALAICGHLLVNALTTCGFLYMSYWNYPGGYAMENFHKVVPSNASVHVHIDVATAQTGVSRFLQINPNWIYNKTEDLPPGGPDMMRYTHLLIGVSGEGDDSEIAPYRNTHKILFNTTGLIKILFKWKEWPPIQPILGPKIYALEKKMDT